MFKAQDARVKRELNRGSDHYGSGDESYILGIQTSCEV